MITEYVPDVATSVGRFTDLNEYTLNRPAPPAPPHMRAAPHNAPGVDGRHGDVHLRYRRNRFMRGRIKRGVSTKGSALRRII